MAKTHQVRDIRESMDCLEPPAAVTERPTPPAVEERMDRLPFKALLRAARALGHGMAQGYETEKGDYVHWRGQWPDYHLNRALRHIALFQAGDTSEDHVDHAVSRILMWGELVDGD